MATQEELAALFARNLSLHNTYVAPVQEPPKVETPITYSISQHYHHSAHLAAEQSSPSRSASEPPQTDQLTTEIILSRHGVDVSTLSPSQVDLFRTADSGQQMRLVELWRICPPNYGGHALTNGTVNFPVTSFEQEETMARLRYERLMQEEHSSRAGGDPQALDSESTMSDESTATPITPIQGGDGRWNSAEPYMVSGYALLAQREYEQSAVPSKDVYSHFGTSVGGPTYNQATDPVYNTVEDIHKFPNVGGDWARLLEQRQQAMENQYGSFTQFQHNAGLTMAGEDEEML
ncbi:hypothetical protein M430DRAFT_157774 [Amorphotheca resinae ATCC 22711]|uniref:Uncharacterized protein n=1 Tax=Amorphotheca resinae ATCC 22711 TaxID=857342 RepID=A0A2T3BE85_AMORE|nr:hypothetical protein M430DRAFT_157774 [Amorphotheca resinae ATCC 22711]PSS27706.1 hypothetical protein M430DRAFT_157774 [Amorphotheca resinae ATCC 22711]